MTTTRPATPGATTAPGTTAPGATAPEGTTPGNTAAGSAAPGATAPEGTTPGATASGATGTVDHRKVFRQLYAPGRTPELLDVPPLQFLMLDGRGDPNGPDFAAAVQALYAVAYGVKFAVRRAGGQDFSVMPLQGLWSAPDPSAFTTGDRQAWEWTVMILQPDTVTPDLVAAARTSAAAKAPASALDRLRLDHYAEGRSAQVLHVGPFSAEGPTIAGLHAFIAAQGLRLRGPHHEIYLSDLRRTAPERLRTVIRQPVE